MTGKLRRSDVSDPDFLDSEELGADGSTAYKDSVVVVSTTASTKTVVISGWNLKDPDDPVEAGDALILTGDAAGTYTVAIIESSTTLAVDESIIDSTGGTAEFRHPPGASRIGYDNTTSGLTSGDVQGAIDEVAVGGGGGAPTNAEYVLSTANGSLPNAIVKPYLKDTCDRLVYPASPLTWNDEFEGGGSVDAKWTLHDPDATVAINQTDFPGILHVTGLSEAAIDTYDHMVHVYQSTMPASNTIWEAKARICLTSLGCGQFAGEFANACVALTDHVAGVPLAAMVANLDSWGAQYSGYINAWKAFNTSTDVLVVRQIDPAMWIWIRLRKTSANAYTSSNTYEFAYSLNGGLTYTDIGLQTLAFANTPDRFGLLFRRPKADASRVVVAEALIDLFRVDYL